uniref:Chlorophyll a-b binding protein, chloroplastic n=1 Tax=Mesocestoides corti TaxID=53468 RepID=A0A5K3G1X1_MESCO
MTCVLRSTTSASSHLKHRSLVLSVAKRSRLFGDPTAGVEYGTDLDRRENVAGTQVPPKWCDAFSAANAKVFGAHGGTNVYTLMQPPPLKEICS